MKKLFLLLALMSLACTGLVAVQAEPTPKTAEVGIVTPAPIEQAEWVEPTAIQAGDRYRVCGNVNVRPMPKAEGAVLDVKYKDQTVTVFEWVGGWARIGEGQYVNGKYLCSVIEE